ncbi:RagB/SusD family nutrient uptake outer membrane protein [Mucilaginibacter sp. HMF5004]|uniref:RagB/SusD family nutrient uptake outer membrane protein n=1 Tax=Mucilaginibacter rivuli TaxID=2857527 RepID=UPI001C5EDDBA|nr:RagB/SusD family nutrient uptake outer membrane protein [Mucilaginibacter rivuli]MBW4889950.1 RagB/SusD family nutrient uptake outer membrane protein [Mucilaginibacter rivuli]
MNKNLSGLVKGSLLLMLCMGSMSSCKKTFDIQPEDALQQNQVYQNIFDADGAILGIYGQFVGLADRYVLLNELRGDLLDVTSNSDIYLKQLSTHTVSADNPYADPRPFYKVINNCNDAMKNFDVMRQNKLLDDNQYYQRYADIGVLRSWIYLQLGIHYGSVPYVTDPIANINDLADAAKFPKLTFDQLLDQLIAFTEAIPKKYLDQNTSTASPTLIMATSIYPIRDGVSKFFIHRRSFLGDLNLWKGNYLKASSYYKDVMETGSNTPSSADFAVSLYDTYKIGNDNSGRNTLFTTGTINPWQNIFSNLLSESETNTERMWTLPLDQNFAVNPFINIFSASAGYLVKPSVLSINNWDNQVRSDGGIGDRRGPNASYRITNGKPEVLKYVSNYSALSPLTTKTGIWLLYRAATLHLRYAEAANLQGRNQLAGVLINDGLYTGLPTKVSTYNGVPDTYPFNFDASKGAVNGVWYRNVGIRGRAVNQNVTFDAGNLVTDTENKIIDEGALETAYEGYRWADLLRIALRRQTTDPNYLANKIGAKFDAAGNTSDAAAVRSRLSDKANWYLPFKWQ